MAFDAGDLELQTLISIRLREIAARLDGAGGLGDRRSDHAGNHAGPRSVQRDAAGYLRQRGCRQEAAVDHRERSGRALPKVQVATTLDALKEAGFHWATRSGATISITDVSRHRRRPRSSTRTKPGRPGPGAVREGSDHRRRAPPGGSSRSGPTRRTRSRGRWRTTSKDNPIFVMINSGARGNPMQVRQLAGMRGLYNLKVEIIPRPIKSNFREGLHVLEYFIRPTALASGRHRAADRRLVTWTRWLVGIAQDVIIREEDCGTDRGILMRVANRGSTALSARTRTSTPGWSPAPWPRTSSWTAPRSRRPAST